METQVVEKEAEDFDETYLIHDQANHNEKHQAEECNQSKLEVSKTLVFLDECVLNVIVSTLHVGCG
jgi:hypothetical protein